MPAKKVYKTGTGGSFTQMDWIWVILAQLVIIGLAVWLYRMPDHGPIPAMLRSGWNRVGGDYHKLLRGKLWEPGEQEQYRVQLRGVTAYTIDRHVPVQGRATCIVTSQRVLLDDGHAHPIQIPRSAIRAVRVTRVYEGDEGFAYWVVLERVGSEVHVPEGDVRLICASQEESRALASALQTGALTSA